MKQKEMSKTEREREKEQLKMTKRKQLKGQRGDKLEILFPNDSIEFDCCFVTVLFVEQVHLSTFVLLQIN